MKHILKIVRVYELKADPQGYRVLVDRLWPRGLRKETLRLDRWAKEAAPTPDLRKWFGHAEERFERSCPLASSGVSGRRDSAFGRPPC